MLALGFANPGRAQGPGPSIPAPLTATSSIVEGIPHLSANGSVLAWHASTYPQRVFAPPLRVDLLAECQGGSILRSAPAAPYGLDPALLGQWRPSVSGDGSRVASLRTSLQDDPNTYYETWLWPRTTPLPVRPGSPDSSFLYKPTSPTNGGYSPLPVPHLSRDGRTVWQAWHFTRVPLISVILELGPDPNVDPVRCFADLVPGTMQPAISRDGSIIAGIIVPNDPLVSGPVPIQRWTRNGPSWCPSDSSIVPAIQTIAVFTDLGVTPFTDVTLSDDGRHIAWTSFENLCVPGTLLPSADIWLWSEAGDPAWPGMTTCPVPPPGVGRLARIPLPDQLWTESRASLDAAGRWLAFVSDGDQDIGGNLNHRPSLFVMDLQAPGPQAIQLSETLPPATGTVGNSNYRAPQVLGYHLSANGEVAAYTVSESPTTSDPWSDADTKIVNIVTASAGTSTDTDPNPADEPYEVTVTACQVFGDTVEATLSLRQWSSQGRKLVVAAWVEDSGQRIPASPLVQSMSGGQAVELRVAVTMPSTPVAPACFANAWDGSAAHPDVQQARLP